MSKDGILNNAFNAIDHQPSADVALTSMVSLNWEAQPDQIVHHILDKITTLAFALPAPNPYTPQIVQLCQEAQHILRSQR